MKYGRLALSALLCCALVPVAACVAVAADPLPAQAAPAPSLAKKPALNLRSKTLARGQSVSLKVAGAAGKKVRWSSSNKRVVTVSATGRVRARSVGRCTIRAKVGKRTLTCKVSVRNATGSIAKGKRRDTAFSLVASAENSTTDYRSTYGYIEDIGDGRGYTCGIIGFTSATGDLLDVVQRYGALKPANNPLKKYVGALKAVNGTDSHQGLGAGFEKAWKRVSRDKEMVQAQNAVLEEQYLKPVIRAANEDGLSPLGQFVYYDALVVHGPGSDGDSFHGMRAAAKRKAKTPAQGGSEATYLKTFLKQRERVMLKEEAHSDLSRLRVQRQLIAAGNWKLARPLAWTLYGDRFTLQ